MCEGKVIVQMFVLVLLLLGLHVNHVKNDNNSVNRKNIIHTFFCIVMCIPNLQCFVRIVSREFLKMIFSILISNIFFEQLETHFDRQKLF